MINRLNLVLLALALSSCGNPGSSDSPRSNGICSTEGPIQQAAASYEIFEAPADLAHLVGATLRYEERPGHNEMTLEYHHEDVDYVITYEVSNAP